MRKLGLLGLAVGLTTASMFAMNLIIPSPEDILKDVDEETRKRYEERAKLIREFVVLEEEKRLQQETRPKA